MAFRCRLADSTFVGDEQIKMFAKAFNHRELKKRTENESYKSCHMFGSFVATKLCFEGAKLVFKPREADNHTCCRRLRVDFNTPPQSLRFFLLRDAFILEFCGESTPFNFCSLPFCLAEVFPLNEFHPSKHLQVHKYKNSRDIAIERWVYICFHSTHL